MYLGPIDFLPPCIGNRPSLAIRHEQSVLLTGISNFPSDAMYHPADILLVAIYHPDDILIYLSHRAQLSSNDALLRALSLIHAIVIFMTFHDQLFSMVSVPIKFNYEINIDMFMRIHFVNGCESTNYIHLE